jgi:hypothetical protein
LKHGEIILSSPYEECKDNAYLAELMDIHRGHKAAEK